MLGVYSKTVSKTPKVWEVAWLLTFLLCYSTET